MVSPRRPASRALRAIAAGPWRTLLRWLPLALAGVVVALAGWLVSGLRSDAVASRTAALRMLDVRYLVTESDRLGWQIVAQGFPNFTFSQQITADRGRLVSDLAYLRDQRALDSESGIDAVRAWVPVLEHDLAVVQALIAHGRAAAANLEMLVGADGEAQLIQQTVEKLGQHFSARAAKANSRMYSGALIALAISGLLVALLAAAFAAGRRRAAAAAGRALAHSERRFRALAERASEVVLVTDAGGRIGYVTDSMRRLTGTPAETFVGQPLGSLFDAEERERTRMLIARAGAAGPDEAPEAGLWQLQRADGSPGTVELEVRNLLTDPDVGGVVITLRDVTARLQAEARLRHQALHDPLTGLANRTLFEDRVAQALNRIGRRVGRVAVMYLDVDGFKAINDSLGHHAGDELLRTLAGRIDECLRGADTAARLGGDEFACLLEDLADESSLLAIGQRINAALSRPTTLSGRTIFVQASVGIASCESASLGAEQLIRNADLAMYKAKAERRGGIALFHADLLEAARRRLDLREDLRRALEGDELALAYQPLVHLESAAVVSTEALLRWHHPRDGDIPPDRFIPVAEESGQIVALGRWVLDRSLADLKRWSPRAPELTLNVNVAPRELTEPDYVEAVAGALARHGIAARRLTLELTESEILDDEGTLDTLHALTELGVGLAIDDFGTGQSSLARLQRLPVTQVKLDRSFLATIDESPQNATLVRSTIELGQALGLQMVAEGIERDGQLRMLRDNPYPRGAAPAPLGQGYFFGRPQPAVAIAGLLASGAVIAAA